MIKTKQLPPVDESRIIALFGDPAFRKASTAADDLDNPSDELVTELALSLWNATYKIDRDEAPSLIYRAARDAGKRVGLKPEAEVMFGLWFGAYWRFAAKWADDAFQKIVFSSHQYAAALMCSDATKEAVSEVQAPWRSFLIVVPDRLIAFVRPDGRHATVARIGVALHDDSADLSLWGENYRSTASQENVTDLLFVPTESVMGPQPEQEDRVHRLARRLVLGTLLSMQHLGNIRRQAAQPRVSHPPRRPPKHRVTLIGAPMKYDLRREIDDYIAGRREASRVPSVQTLVRGHFKRQVFGTRRSERRVIWIEPYWRGPDEAPILARPRKLGSSPDVPVPDLGGPPEKD